MLAPVPGQIHDILQQQDSIRCIMRLSCSVIYICLLYSPTPFYEEFLFDPQHSRSSSFCSFLLLISLVEGYRAGMVSSKVVEVLDLIYPNDPILAGKRFFQRVELGTFRWQLRATNSILSLSRWEEGVVVVVGHFVP